MMSNVSLKLGDITSASADAIVNAANETLEGGGGVDGAIHRAAGRELLAACMKLPEYNDVRCPVGEARITTAGNLDANYVIHTVGPRYGFDPHPEQLLASAYHNSYQLALEYGCRSLAVPAISCGVYLYPVQAAAEIALGVSTRQQYRELSITFYLFNQAIYDDWNAVLLRMRGATSYSS